jgi:hypothetical protein
MQRKESNVAQMLSNCTTVEAFSFLLSFRFFFLCCSLFFFFERRTQRGREEASIYLECDASVKPGGEEAARGDQN